MTTPSFTNDHHFLMNSIMLCVRNKRNGSAGGLEDLIGLDDSPMPVPPLARPGGGEGRGGGDAPPRPPATANGSSSTEEVTIAPQTIDFGGTRRDGATDHAHDCLPSTANCIIIDHFPHLNRDWSPRFSRCRFKTAGNGSKRPEI
jgi:hypothetical protein